MQWKILIKLLKWTYFFWTRWNSGWDSTKCQPNSGEQFIMESITTK